MALATPSLSGLDPASVQQWLQAQAAANQQDFAEKVRQFDLTFGTNVGKLLGVYNGQNTLDEQSLMGIGANGQPTLAAQKQMADLTGQYNGQNTEATQQALGFANNGNPFLNTGEAMGYITLPDGTKVPTLQARTQGIQNAQAGAKLILDSNAGAQANPFSYLAKFGGLQNAGVLGSLLGGAASGATGQSQSQLASQAPYSNTNLATDLVANAQGSQVSPAGQSFLASLIPGYQPSTAGASAAGNTSGLANAGGFDANAAFSQLISALHQSNPNAGGTNLMTGFGTPIQSFSKLAPSGQSAWTDLVANAGGENQGDFLSGLKKAAPEFAGSNAASQNIQGF